MVTLPTPPLLQPSTYLLSTAISFSMLVSFPFSAFLGMHLMATIFPVAFSRAITTSENAPLRDTQGGNCFHTPPRPVLTQTSLIAGELTEATHRQTGQSTQTTYWEYLLRTGRDHPPHSFTPWLRATDFCVG